MLKIETSRFGTLQVDEDKVIVFPQGLLGFPNLKRYILMDYKDTTVKWLQAVDNHQVAFIVVEPQFIAADYSINIGADAREAIGLENNNDLSVLLIVRVENDKVIANLNGPLLINASLKRGVQAVLEKV
ncbi:MAG: flagellar assembly protein FliW [Nitrospirae bacterium]|nr:flagellar assembly protein FliW [Nitrospirota bacterium]